MLGEGFTVLQYSEYILALRYDLLIDIVIIKGHQDAYPDLQELHVFCINVFECFEQVCLCLDVLNEAFGSR
jgi:hypothetical protein